MRCARTILIPLCLILTVPAAADDDFTFVILGDRTGGHQEGVYARVIEKSLIEGAELYLTVGDQIEGYTEDTERVRREWTEYLELIEAVEAAFYMVPGNHDIWDEASEEIWEEVSGFEPNYAFEFAGVHFVILDTSRLNNPAEIDLETLVWLEDELDGHRDQITLVFYHKPLWFNFAALGREDPLHELLVDYGVEAVFCGHYHTYAADVIDGVTYTMVGSSGGHMWDDIPEHGHFYHYLVGRIDDGGLSLEIVPLEHEGRWEHGYLTAVELHGFERFNNVFDLGGVFVGENPAGERVDFELTLTNPLGEPLDALLSWESAGDWSIAPREVSLLLEPGESLRLEFIAELAEGGAFYPLPWAEVRLPYREDRYYRAGTCPLILRSEVARPLTEPLIDGILAATEWEGAGVTDSFAGDQGGPSDAEATRFFWGYGPEHLYIAAECVQEDPASIRAETTERDGAVYYDDCVGFFFAPRGSAGDVYQVYLSVRDVIFDQRIFTGEEGLETDTSWNADIRHAVRYEGGVWTAELAVPYTELGMEPPAPGDAWRVNFRRKQAADGATADWQHPIDYAAEGFGRLIFVEG
jgi:predicted phosphohydrolase